MTEPHRPRVKYVIGPDGSPLTIADLAGARHASVGSFAARRRWSPRCVADFCRSKKRARRYTLTVEEFLAWQYSIDRHGLAGLRTTRIQQYRQ